MSTIKRDASVFEKGVSMFPLVDIYEVVYMNWLHCLRRRAIEAFRRTIIEEKETTYCGLGCIPILPFLMTVSTSRPIPPGKIEGCRTPDDEGRV